MDPQESELRNTVSPTDKLIVCCDCRTEFTFTAGEQEFYASKGLSTPKRCVQCRHAKKDSFSNLTSIRGVEHRGLQRQRYRFSTASDKFEY